ncbi:MAG: PAS domain S-box protein [Acidobacteria bacterium]|nr:MAG: PAS domain S-box protein [Acidobacteriota bacterium]
MNSRVIKLETLPVSREAEEATCHLLDRLESDLRNQVQRLNLESREPVEQIIREVVARYSRVVCQEKPEVESLRRLQTELQSAIDRNEQFLAHILKDSADAIITVDAKGRIIIWNKGAEAIFGFREDEIVGHHIQRLLPPGREYELRQIEEQTRRLGAVNSRLTQWRTRDGKTIQVILTSTAIKDGAGSYAGSSLVVKDVTRQREMEDLVRQAEHFSSIGRLAAGLAHEIKNPLAGIQGAIEVIKDRTTGELETDILSEVLCEVGRIDKIVRDLLNYAKPKTAELRPLQLEPLVRHVIGLLKESGGKDVRFVVEGKPAARNALVKGDGNYLEQVFMNLLLNSLEAMNRQGTIRVGFKEDQDTVQVRIQDSGPGVPLGVQGKIFDPFFTTKQSGTGLGLSICQRITHEHGGSLALDPDVKKGAAFIMKLPRYQLQ